VRVCPSRQSCIIPRNKNNRRQGDIMPVRSTTLPTVLLALAALIAASVSGGAQTYPDRPVKIIVPIGPSGSYDIVGRLLADQLSTRLGPGRGARDPHAARTLRGHP